MEEEEGTLVEDEEEPKTPSQLALEGEDKENTNKKCCESFIVQLWHQDECRSPSYVCYHRHTSK
jgi:hypothetical protein